MRLYDKKFNNKKECIMQIVCIFYSSVIKPVHTFIKRDLARATKCC